MPKIAKPDIVKPDAFNVEAIERSVNDSATRVSTIWISFLIFGLYLLTAATTVTQKQLFLAEPVKLPVLNIDLPLWGFFWLAPILFVTLHIYVLLQVLLLARTTAAYESALARTGLSPAENASMRQRLANTLFAQIFAGSPRERGGFVGGLLQAIVWVTLAAAPVLILLAFQVSFLAYHSHIATWTHRILILVEMAAFFVLWPMALDARKDFAWRHFRQGLRRVAATPVTLAVLMLWPLAQRRWGFDWPRHQPPRSASPQRLQVLSLSGYSAIALVSLFLATFPGEPHINLAAWEPVGAVKCNDRWIYQDFESIDLRYDRLILPNIDAVDDDKLAKFAEHNVARKLPASKGERTQIFRGRDFNCGDFSSGDFRRADLTGAGLQGADLSSASLTAASLDSAQLKDANLNDSELQGATLNDAQLQNTELSRANLIGASLERAQLQGAQLSSAQLQGANLDEAALQGAVLRNARLQGASLSGAQMQGASLESAQMQAAKLDDARLQGANLRFARLQGASLMGAQLQGANLERSQLQGASLDESKLQGASLVRANLDHTSFSKTWLWGAETMPGNCSSAFISEANLKPVIADLDSSDDDDDTIPNGIDRFVERSLIDVPLASRNGIANSHKKKMTIAPIESERRADIWRNCQRSSNEVSQPDFAAARVTIRRDSVCKAVANASFTVAGIVRNWIFVGPGFTDERKEKVRESKELARALLGEDGKACASRKEYDPDILTKLRAAAGPPPESIPSK